MTSIRQYIRRSFCFAGGLLSVSMLLAHVPAGEVHVLPEGGIRIHDPSSGTELRLQLTGVGRPGTITLPWQVRSTCSMGSRIVHQAAGWEAHYTPTPDGIRQDLLVLEKPSGYGDLQVFLDYPVDCTPTLIGPNNVQFSRCDGSPAFAYNDLRVYDACGNRLPARMLVDPQRHTLTLTVEDAAAVYPVLVDPVATTHNTVLLGPITDARFGKSVATAGDLNGDGYSDVVVGARDYDNGQSNEGSAFVYYGSANGIGTVPDVVLESDQVGASFGNAVSTAGDVNGDGFSDLLIGAPNWESDPAGLGSEGAIFVYHGSSTGVSTVPNAVRRANSAAKYMGWSVACAGDIDNDGYSDIITGGWLASYGQTNEGAAWVFKGGPTGIAATPVHRLERNQVAAQFGHSVAGAGDVNGDGYSDVVVGSHAFDLNVTNDGATFIYHGGPTNLGGGLNPAPATIFTGPGGTHRSSWSVASAGDVNGDGFSDIITGHYLANNGEPLEEGVACIHHGSPTGIGTSATTILDGGQTNAWFGRSVSGAGDMNGDGYADVAVGAVTFTAGQSLEGAAFLFLGSPAGVSTTFHRRYELNQPGANMGESVAAAGDVNGDGFSDLIVGAENLGGALSGGAAIYHGGTEYAAATPTLSWGYGTVNGHAGSSVAHAGDVNGDGYGDVIVGVPDATSTLAGEGNVHVHYGSTSGPTTAANVTLAGGSVGARYGASVSTAGDVNGDGYADVLIGAPNASGGGRVAIHHGSAAGLLTTPAWSLNGSAGSELGAAVMTAGDVNSDGFADVIVAAPAIDEVRVYLGTAAGTATSPHITFTPPASGILFGASVSTAGDVNGDGYSDVIVGAPLYSNGHNEEGAILIYHGSDTGLVDMPDRIIEGASANAHFGVSVAGIGDVNGDGYDEVAIGADQHSAGQLNEGRVAVYRGSNTGITTILNDLFSNLDGARLGFSLSELGDVNGDGYADLMAGAPTFTGTLTEQGCVWLWHGSPIGLNTPQLLTGATINARFGQCAAGAGDLDGDGYSDVLVGEPFHPGGSAEEGQVHWYRGNNALSIDRLTRQYHADLASPLSTNSHDMFNIGVFGVGHRTRSPIQRTHTRLCWEVVTEGQPFAGAPITTSVLTTGCAATFTDIAVAGQELKELVAKTPGYVRYKWRLRPEYAMNKLIDGQRYGRWFYGSVGGTGDIGILPVELTDLQAWAETAGNRITWQTASEVNSNHFVLERSTDAQHFIPIEEVSAGGTSLQLLSYELLDHRAPQGLSYYRLRMVDRDGYTEHSHIVTAWRSGRRLLIYPDPAQDLLRWQGPTAARVEVMDALGKVVIGTAINGTELSVARLDAGTYTLRLWYADGNMVATARFVKEGR